MNAHRMASSRICGTQRAAPGLSRSQQLHRKTAHLTLEFCNKPYTHNGSDSSKHTSSINHAGAGTALPSKSCIPNHGARARDTPQIRGPPHHKLDARKQWQHITNQQADTVGKRSRHNAPGITKGCRIHHQEHTGTIHIHGNSNRPTRQNVSHAGHTDYTGHSVYSFFTESGTGGKHLRLGRKTPPGGTLHS